MDTEITVTLHNREGNKFIIILNTQTCNNNH